VIVSVTGFFMFLSQALDRIYSFSPEQFSSLS